MSEEAERLLRKIVEKFGEPDHGDEAAWIQGLSGPVAEAEALLSRTDAERERGLEALLGPIAEPFHEILRELEGGDIHFHALQEALLPLFENWTAVTRESASDEGAAYDPEAEAEDLFDQFAEMEGLIATLRERIRSALESAAGSAASGPSLN